MEFDFDGRRHLVRIRREPGGWHAAVDGRDVRVDACRIGDRWSLLLDPPGLDRVAAARVGATTTPVKVSHEVTVDVRSPGECVVHVDGYPVVLSRPIAGRSGRGGRTAATGEAVGGWQQVVAPMPGRIVKVLVQPGDEVHRRQPLVVIEAMKMENELRAAHGGIVAEVLAAEGALVEAKAVLVVLR